MSKPRSWRDVKAEAQAIDPTWDAPERTADRGRMREETSLETLRAYVAGLGGHLDIVARIGNIHLNVA